MAAVTSAGAAHLIQVLGQGVYEADELQGEVRGLQQLLQATAAAAVA
jgi:hypothetical protein